MRAVERQIEKTEGVRTTWQVVTPELAIKWLEGNTHNRSVRDGVVTRYAADMKAGRWRQTHQGIAFDEHSTLIDGQHRLYAVMESGASVLLQVTTGLPMETQAVVDDGIRRTLVDVLKVSDEAMAGLSALHTAVGRRMELGLNPRPSRPMTRQEDLAFLTKQWEAISFAVGLFNHRVRGITTAPVIAPVARAFHHEDRALLARFVAVLLSGQSLEARDSTVIVLRNWLVTRKGGGGDTIAIEIYGKTSRALHAFTHEQLLGRGKLYAVSEDPYPLPGAGVRGRR